MLSSFSRQSCKFTLQILVTWENPEQFSKTFAICEVNSKIKCFINDFWDHEPWTLKAKFLDCYSSLSNRSRVEKSFAYVIQSGLLMRINHNNYKKIFIIFQREFSMFLLLLIISLHYQLFNHIDQNQKVLYKSLVQELNKNTLTLYSSW